MKVWEKVSKEMTKQLGHEYKSKDSVRSDLYMMKITPCELNEQFYYLPQEVMDISCLQDDCNKCLDKYLDAEVKE